MEQNKSRWEMQDTQGGKKKIFSGKHISYLSKHGQIFNVWVDDFNPLKLKKFKKHIAKTND